MSEEMQSQQVNEEQQESEAVAATSAEATVGEGTEEASDIQALLEDARSKADEHWNQVLRLQADLENTRRRAERDVESAHKFALEKFALELLPVKDSLEMGLAAAEGSDHDVAEKLREGTELTLKMLCSAMEKFGIKEVAAEGEPFNPEWHQAMTMQPSNEHAPNTVVVVMQKGYLLNERLLRPAMVVVSKASS